MITLALDGKKLTLLTLAGMLILLIALALTWAETVTYQGMTTARTGYSGLDLLTDSDFDDSGWQRSVPVLAAVLGLIAGAGMWYAQGHPAAANRPVLVAAVAALLAFVLVLCFFGWGGLSSSVISMAGHKMGSETVIGSGAYLALIGAVAVLAGAGLRAYPQAKAALDKSMEPKPPQ